VTRTFTEWSVDDFLRVLYGFRFTRKITAVHVHHTWSPTIAQWNGLASMVGMWKFHTMAPKWVVLPKDAKTGKTTNVGGQGWSDIAQHATIDPQGEIWSGRDWNKAPASSGSHNGTSAAGPFMYEMIGNFDTGKEKLQGAQRDSAIIVIAHVLHVANLPWTAFNFHRQLGSPKTCPGTGVDYDDFTREVRAYRNGLARGGVMARQNILDR
jgi:hypothetical protein